MGISLSVAQTEQSILYDEAKRYIRLDHDEDMKLIEDDLIPDAERYVEQFLHLDFIQKTYIWTLPQFPNSCSRMYYPLVFPKNPLIDTDSLIVQYYANDVLETWGSSNYELITDRLPNQLQLLKGKSFPTTDERDDAVQITFKAGMTTSYKTVPKDIKNAICMTVWGFYDMNMYCSELELNRALLAKVGHRKLYDERIFLYTKPKP